MITIFSSKKCCLIILSQRNYQRKAVCKCSSAKRKNETGKRKFEVKTDFVNVTKQLLYQACAYQ